MTSESSHAPPTTPAPPKAQEPAPPPQISNRGRSWRWWLWKAGKMGIVLAVIVALIAGVGVAQRQGWLPSSGRETAEGNASAGDIYTCPMHPQIRQDVPGRCPICGMELVPAAADAGSQEEYAVRIEPAARRIANIQTASVARSTLDTTLRTVGRIAFDESRQATISAYIDGRIERLFADYTGVRVAKDDHLAVIYSPQLYAAQVEFVESRDALSEMGSGVLPVVRQTQERLVKNARQRLVELGMTPQQIADLERTGEPQSRLTIYTPIGGTVVEKLAVEGKYVKAGDPIYRVADLSMVWLMLELFPEDAARVRFGQTVETEVQSIPGEMFEGRVAFIDPVVDEKTRTVGVRVEMLNSEGRLRPGDYAAATIHVPLGQTGTVYDADLAGKWISPMHPQIIREEPGKCPICGMDLVRTTKYGYSEEPLPQPTSLIVPRQAVLMAGDSSVVYVETEPGRFEIRPVTIGAFLQEARFAEIKPGHYEYRAHKHSESIQTRQGLRGGVQILEGLKEGEIVATSGNFLIDSQMQLAGNPSLIDPTRAIQKSKEGPLDLGHIHIAQIPEDTGKALENLYQAYFAMQAAFASDRMPTDEDRERLIASARQLESSAALSAHQKELVRVILDKAPHLHHAKARDFKEQAEKAIQEADSEAERNRRRSLWAAREQFRPMSQAVVRLAAEVRGESGETPFTHFYCPMVPGGDGDWLQAGADLGTQDLTNPYWGSIMPHCGEKIHEFPAEGHPAPERKE